MAPCAASTGAVRARGKPAARILPAPCAPVRCNAAAVQGSEVSPGRLLEDQLVERQVRDRSPQPRVLLLKVLHPASLIRLQAAILLAPTVVGLLADRDPPARLGGRAALAQHDLHLTQLADDLLRL